MTWELIINGTPWAIAVGLAWAVWNGHLVLGRELEDLKKDYADLRERHSSTTERLAASQNAERDRLLAEIAEMRAERAASKRGEPT